MPDKTWEQDFQLLTTPSLEEIAKHLWSKCRESHSILAVPIELLVYIQHAEGDFSSKITWWRIIQGSQTGHENVASNIEFHYFRQMILLKRFCCLVKNFLFLANSIQNTHIDMQSSNTLNNGYLMAT